jgi:hypothetical protein
MLTGGFESAEFQRPVDREIEEGALQKRSDEGKLEYEFEIGTSARQGHDCVPFRDPPKFRKRILEFLEGNMLENLTRHDKIIGCVRHRDLRDLPHIGDDIGREALVEIDRRDVNAFAREV